MAINLAGVTTGSFFSALHGDRAVAPEDAGVTTLGAYVDLVVHDGFRHREERVVVDREGPAGPGEGEANVRGLVPAQLFFDSGAPNRHSNVSDPAKCAGGVDSKANYGVVGGTPQKGLANYLFADGHVETLSGEVALRALITRNW